MIAQAKNSSAIFDWTYFAAGLLMLPEGFVLTAKMVLAVGKFVLNTSLVQSLASCFKAGATEGAEAAEAVADVAEKTASEGSSDIAEVGEVTEDVAEAVSIMGTLGTLFKVLGGIGFVVTLVVGIVEIVEGAQQKSDLINAIHSCQSSRLAIKYFKVQADNVLQNLTTMALYLDALVGTATKKANPAVAAYLADGIMQSISDSDATIDWSELEGELETQDKTSGLYYGDDDMSTADVIKIAQGKAGPPPPIYVSPDSALATPAPVKATPAPAKVTSVSGSANTSAQKAAAAAATAAAAQKKAALDAAAAARNKAAQAAAAQAAALARVRAAQAAARVHEAMLFHHR